MHAENPLAGNCRNERRNGSMALVLFNIGWMQYYRGQTSSDRIINGGKYVNGVPVNQVPEEKAA